MLLASEFRALGLWVSYDPIPEYPYHGEVWGNFSKGRQRMLLRVGSWLVPVPGINHPPGPNT